MLRYFRSSFIFTLLGLPLCAYVGYYYNPTPAAAIQAFFIATVLAVLEVSLSFDNAIVNAVVLKEMTPKWRHRFLTWGMLIAVFGMRLVFPLLIVTFAAGLNPWDALVLAASEPNRYSEIMLSAHANVAAFGGCFLMMVALKYFYDENKELHWIVWIERITAELGKVEAIEIAITLGFLAVLSRWAPPEGQASFLISGMAGIVVYVVVDGISGYLERFGASSADMHRASAGLFLYLEVLDASFSFDGVVGAFAITNNLFIIMIGLSIGAFFVRSLTILFVEKETLDHFTYLEHGAFYAIGALAILMLCDPVVHIPEWITGLIGAVFIAAAFWSSLRVRKMKSSAAMPAK
ncbi:MAG: DUF475 domain-containing protein [Bdellovibrionaceae bacterium]|nr:DUF475 domain-containing protein [Pseudobdellovibrionaceae bacterium]MBX3033314.1 DUF475 domain-containing protein [Pseudobdellovibrionaceae bacterium]